MIHQVKTVYMFFPQIVLSFNKLMNIEGIFPVLGLHLP